MKYRSPTNGPVRISSTSGHVMIIGEQLVEVPPELEAEARYVGCVSEEIVNSIASGMQLSQTGSVKDVIMSMIKNPGQNYFTAGGLPNLKVVSKLCGHSVSKEEMQSAWDLVSAELDASEAV